MYKLVGTNHKRKKEVKIGTICLCYSDQRGFLFCIYLGKRVNKITGYSFDELYILGSVNGYYSSNKDGSLHRGRTSTRYYFADLDYITIFGQYFIDYTFSNSVDENNIVESTNIIIFDIDLDKFNIDNFDKWLVKNKLSGKLGNYENVVNPIDITKYVRKRDLELGKIYSNAKRNTFYVYGGITCDNQMVWFELYYSAILAIVNGTIRNLQDLRQSGSYYSLTQNSLRKVYELENINVNVNSNYNNLYRIGKLNKC